MILVTCSSVTAEKEANVGGGESGVMCQKLSEVEKREPFENGATNTEPIQKTSEENGMINSIKGSREIKKYQGSSFTPR